MACCKKPPVGGDNYSSFAGACYTGNLDKMKAQLKVQQKTEKDPVNATNGDDGMSPLHRAAQKGDAAVIQFLLNEKADARKQSKKTGETPLHVACFHRNGAAVAALLESEAKQDVNIQDQHGYTPLLIAVNRGSPDIADRLMGAGADPTIPDNYGQDAIEMSKALKEQEEQGLSSPTAEHSRTYHVVLKRSQKK